MPRTKLIKLYAIGRSNTFGAGRGGHPDGSRDW